MDLRCWCGRFLGRARRIDDTTVIEVSDLSDPAAAGRRGRARTGDLRIKASASGALDVICPRHGPHTVRGVELDRALRHRHRVYRVPRRIR